MGFSIGGSKNKSKQSSTTNQNTSSTSMPIVPDYIQNLMPGYYAQVGNLLGTGGYQQQPAAAAAQAAANGNLNYMPNVSSTPANQYSAYGAANPDVAAEAAKVVGTDARFPTADAFYQWHYQNYGQNEGRTLPTAQTQTPVTQEAVAQTQQAPAGTQPNQYTMGTTEGNGYIPGVSPQQAAAYEAAMNLGQNQGYYATAGQLGLYGGLTPAAQAAATTIDPTSNVSTQVVNGVERIDPITLAAAAKAAGVTLDPAFLAAMTNVDPTKTYEAQSVLTNLQDYMNPFTNDVVNTTLAQFDNKTASDKAKMAAQAALAGNAFGNSRYGLQLSNFDTLSNLNRASTEAGLRSDAFAAGATMSADDANRRQDALKTNTAAENARAALQAQLNQNNNQFNAGSINDRNIAQGQLTNQTNIANAGFENDRNIAQGQLDFNVGNANATFGNNKLQKDAEMAQQKALADAAAANARAMQQAQLTQEMNVFNAQQKEAEANRALAAAALFGNLGDSSGASSRADIATQIAAGQDNRSTAFDQNTADFQRLAAIQGLLGVSGSDLFGQQTNSTMNGTSSGKSSGYGLNAGWSQ